MTQQLIRASAHSLPMVADGSVQCIVTSPPYFGLRAYDGDQAIEWPTVEYAPMPGLPVLTVPAMRSPLGLEPTIEAYIGHLILCLREWRRVLRDDGLCWVNLGDSFSGGGQGDTKSGFNERYFGKSFASDKQAETAKSHPVNRKPAAGLPAKNLMMIPARFALAAQADGWWLRSAMPWLKRNGMPESATDRPSQVVESVFMLAKSERYFFDMEAVKVPVAESSIGRLSQDIEHQTGTTRANGGAKTNGNLKALGSMAGRNLRSSDLFFRTWQGLLSNDEGDPLALIVNSQPFSASHFAVFPELIPELAILAGTSARGACPQCGAGWKRVVERTDQPDETAKGSRFDHGKTAVNGNGRVQVGERFVKVAAGWQPSCTCNAGEPQPCVVCDPFHGSGTTGRVAARLGRSYIGVDLSEKYLSEITDARMGGGVQMEMSY